MPDPMPLAEAIAETEALLALSAPDAGLNAEQEAALRTLLAYAEAWAWVRKHGASIGQPGDDWSTRIVHFRGGPLPLIEATGPDLPAAVSAARAKLEGG